MQACDGEGLCAAERADGLDPVFWQGRTGDGPDPEPAPEGAPARVVTIDDLARFLPADVELHAEPDGWAVVGVPANFWTRVQPVVVDGELLGEAAAVRFTPRLYRWDYGDGTSRTSATGGSSWADAGLEELAATPTSHVYRAEADVRAAVTVYWSAEYRFAGGPWIAVAGAVAGEAPTVELLVVRERTVLTVQ